MNDLQAQASGAVKSSVSNKSLSSAPQVDQSMKEVTAGHTEAESLKVHKGNQLPNNGQEVAAEVEEKEMVEAVSKLNEYVQTTQRHLDFQLDEESGRTVVRVYDTQSDELVRQIPDEAALELAKKLNTEEPSLLFSAQV